jgi:hypothetical protein
MAPRRRPADVGRETAQHNDGAAARLSWGENDVHPMKHPARQQAYAGSACAKAEEAGRWDARVINYIPAERGSVEACPGPDLRPRSGI